MKQLKINNPCSKKWEEMQGEGKIRHCESCDYAVMDLTDKSQEELIELIEKSEKRICARVRKSQLDPVKKIAAAVMLGSVLLGCSPRIDYGYDEFMAKQNSKAGIFYDKTFPARNIPDIHGNIPVKIKGTLYGEDNIYEPLPFATIWIASDNKLIKGAKSEVDFFEFDTVLNYKEFNKAKIFFSYVGYKRDSIPLSEINGVQDLKIIMKSEFEEGIEVGYIEYK